MKIKIYRKKLIMPLDVFAEMHDLTLVIYEKKGHSKFECYFERCQVDGIDSILVTATAGFGNTHEQAIRDLISKISGKTLYHLKGHSLIEISVPDLDEPENGLKGAEQFEIQEVWANSMRLVRHRLHI